MQRERPRIPEDIVIAIVGGRAAGAGLAAMLAEHLAPRTAGKP